MKNFTSKFKSWYKDLNSSKSNYEKKGISPLKDWNFLLSLTFVLLFSTMALAFYFYKEIESGNLFTVVNNVKANETKINDKLLKKTVDDINQREQTTSAVLEGKDFPSDPSVQ